MRFSGYADQPAYFLPANSGCASSLHLLNQFDVVDACLVLGAVIVHSALLLILQLVEIEDRVKSLNAQERRRVRQTRSKLIAAKFDVIRGEWKGKLFSLCLRLHRSQSKTQSQRRFSD